MSEPETTKMTCAGDGCTFKYTATPGARGYCPTCQAKRFPVVDSAAARTKRLEFKALLRKTKLDPRGLVDRKRA